MYRVVTRLLLLMVSSVGFAQESKWKPTVVPAIHFSQVCVARMSKDEPTKVTVLVPQFKYETKQQTVTKMRTETRIRTIQVNGEPKQQRYAVQVPITIQQSTTVAVPTETDVINIDVEKLQAWDINGEELDSDEIRNRLKKPKHTFRLKTQVTEDNKISPYYAGVLDPDVIFIYLRDVPKVKEE